MTLEQKQIKLAEALGYRRWKFGDPWTKGLKLADGRFNGYIRRIIKDAEPDSKTVLLDIDEAWTNQVSEVVKHYTPRSHWVKDGVVKASLPDYFNDLNACHQMEKFLTFSVIDGVTELQSVYISALWKVMGKPDARMIAVLAHATAAQRAEAFGKTLNLW